MKQHEFELLADYVGGALDGTPEAAEVTRRIRENAAWAQAHSELTAALRSVETDLAAAARTDQTMPDDVWSMLQAALADAPRTDAPPAAATSPESPHWVPPAPIRPAPAERPARRRWRWLAPIGVAAAVLAVSCFGLNTLRNSVQTASDNAATGMKGTTEAALPAGLIELHSGRDYTAATLAVLTDDSVVAEASRNTLNYADSAGLSRFNDPALLAGCLEALRQVIPGRLTVVDLAQYQGTPAVLAVIDQGTGTKIVGVAGVECRAGNADLKDQKAFN
jgi:hypothetical protein